MNLNEATVEDAALDWLGGLGFTLAYGLEIAPGEPAAARGSFETQERNDWLAVNQFTVLESGHNRRADVVVFVNGLPLAVIELKNAADENATIWTAWNQLQTYKEEIRKVASRNVVQSQTCKRRNFHPIIDRPPPCRAHTISPISTCRSVPEP